MTAAKGSYDIPEALKGTEEDWSVTENILKKVNPRHYLVLNLPNGTPAIRCNWVSSLMASILLWSMVAWCIESPAESEENLLNGQAWVTQNFTWLYIGTQDVWCVFLIWLCFSKYGDIRMGKDDEKPQYSDLAWFAMLFACGLGIGLFYWGVSEPIYYYRGYSNMYKVPWQNDDGRAQQAIFVTLFHWGLHGWVPYIVCAVNLGVVCHRNGYPLAPRYCFQPLLGDDVTNSLLGDIIDAVSIACTTYGVCTSLGMGASGICQGIARLSPDMIDCNSVNDNSWIIAFITMAATVSVLTGISRGIKALSFFCVLLSTFFMLTVLFADNTWYLLNLVVQSTGHYFQWIIQVGFDCEAFQQLNYELDVNYAHTGSSGAGYFNMLMGSSRLKDGNPTNLIQKLEDVEDSYKWCFINGMGRGACATLCAAAAYAPTMMPTASAVNATMFESVSGKNFVYADGVLSDVSPTQPPAPTAMPTDMPIVSSAPSSTAMPTDMPSVSPAPTGTPTTASPTTCEAATSTNFLKSWDNYPNSMYGQNWAKFMDWWTIFYWGWWISWAPFVGVFVAEISRGRTVRNVIIGAFFLPVAYSIAWFSIFGGIAIKMQRVAELALAGTVTDSNGDVVEYDPLSPDCSALGYSGGEPATTEAMALADMGYYPLKCRGHSGRTYDAMSAYPGIKTFLWLCILVGLFGWFITSSDSGSMVDTLTSAQGHRNTPAIQEIYWSATEGISAIALIQAAGRDGTGASLKGLRAVSLICGLPMTIALCYMCSATLQACKIAMGDADIVAAPQWSTNANDIWIGFSGSSVAERVVDVVIACVCPFMQLNAAAGAVWGKTTGLVLAACMTCFWYIWLLFVLIGYGKENDGSAQPFYFLYNIGWALYFMWCLFLFSIRANVRKMYGIYGTYTEDLWQCCVQPPFIISQLAYQVRSPVPTPEEGKEVVDIDVSDESKGGGVELETRKAAESEA